MVPGFLAFAGPRVASSGLALREALPADAAFIAAVYASVREEELRPVPWTDEQKRAFTDWQSAQQEAHYALHYPQAERLVVLADEAIGRIYVDTTASEVRLMELPTAVFSSNASPVRPSKSWSLPSSGRPAFLSSALIVSIGTPLNGGVATL